MGKTYKDAAKRSDVSRKKLQKGQKLFDKNRSMKNSNQYDNNVKFFST